MASRMVIRAQGNVSASVIAAMVFGGLASLGLRIVFVALGLGETGLWVWGLLAVCAALVWGVIHVLWSAFGVALIISPAGIRKPGPFRGVFLAREGLRLGRYDTVRMGAIGTSGDKRAREVTEIWALGPTGGAVLLLDLPRNAPQVARFRQGAALHLDLPLHVMTAQGRAGFDT